MVENTDSTLSRNCRFGVVSLNEKFVVIFVHSTKKPRLIPLDEIEDEWKALIRRREIKQTDILGETKFRCSTYITALFAQIPGVTYVLKPRTTLFYNR
jgi:hypothetical protein